MPRFPRRKPRTGTKKSWFTPLRLGLLFLVVVLLGGTALFNKDRILTTLRPGETFQINFAADNRLVPYLSQVKVSFVPIGVVSGVDSAPDGSATVSVKVDDGIRAKLGTEPSAVIRPTTLLGGNYFIDLVPGGPPGEFTGDIPRKRTSLPVELDKVAAALQPSALKGLTDSVGNVDTTLKDGGQAALDKLVADAPGALDPAAGVLAAATGDDDADLTKLVSGLESASRTLTDKQGQLNDVVSGLHTTTSVLSRRADDLASAVRQMPSTLDSTDAGLVRLKVTLDKLKNTADPARPVATALATALDHADPVLAKAEPVVKQLNGLLVNARPLVEDLVPASQQATALLNDVRGPVLDRIDGPVKTFLQTPYNGSGSFASSTSDKPMYEDLGYMFATLDRASSMSDRNGPAISFHPGIGVGSLGGLPISLEQMFTQLSTQFGIPLQKGAAPK
ncbi:MAG: mammalian cell entry protein [Amycolatopsis sp.]|uniref:MlaD family protein n=1 Tax=Amycolatopsis sp. TaxID=37632 RepID=UPI00260E405E|nr:mammalian cell entry protein [Amycolatopsis sp.]MCU1679975.1 mammalian cell entry protein [Amycolatopsis sp.]